MSKFEEFLVNNPKSLAFFIFSVICSFFAISFLGRALFSLLPCLRLLRHIIHLLFVFVADNSIESF